MILEINNIHQMCEIKTVMQQNLLEKHEAIKEIERYKQDLMSTGTDQSIIEGIEKTSKQLKVEAIIEENLIKQIKKEIKKYYFNK